jgi:hypothetical protein
MRLVIHAGFGKCGSSSIQHALQNRRSALKRQSIFLFGNHLRLDDGLWPSSTPFWMAGNTLRDGQSRGQVLDRVSREIERVAARRPESTAIISAELLGRPAGGRIFRTIDAKVDTTLVFYIRPQFQWIPSAWKQWIVSRGISLEDFTASCLAAGRPRFRDTLESWRADLPQAKSIVRVLPDTVAVAGGPAKDFLTIVGARLDRGDEANLHVNPSFDVSILRVLNKNPWLFAERRETEIFRALAEILPERFLNTNTQVLSFEDEKRIAARFHEENLDILRTQVGLSEQRAMELYARYYQPQAPAQAPADVSDSETLYRSAGVLLDVLIRQHQSQQTIVRAPYWKIPWRAVKRQKSRGSRGGR